MNFQKLFETQRLLDDLIEKEKGLVGQDLLSMKILALQVELGELANEWRGFKFWSGDREPRTQVLLDCTICEGTGDLNYEMVQEDAEGTGRHEYIDCEECGATGKGDFANPLLEEYVDCLHFILSIGLELEIQTLSGYIPTSYIYGNDITRTFTYLMADAPMINSGFGKTEKEYVIFVNHFMHLGSMLGFDWEQIEQAYYAKNQINHERQATGY